MIPAQAHPTTGASKAERAMSGLEGQQQQQEQAHNEHAAAATLAQDAPPGSAQVRSLPPHLHAAKRPPAGPPSKPPPVRARAPPVLIPPPNAWPTAPLPLPSRLSKKPEQLQRPAHVPITVDPNAALPQPGQPASSELQHASAWASFQHNAAVSMQKAHSIDTGGSFQAAQPGAKPSSHRRSLDSLSPFASASTEAPNWGEDLPAAPAALPAPAGAAWGSASSADREGSLKNISSISSLCEWGVGKAVARRGSTERLPSLQDWMLPLCISSPGHKPDAMARTCSQDLLCGEAMPRPEQLVQWAHNAGARPAAPAAPVRASHELLERMPNALPEALFADALPLADRNDSASPKRSRGDDSPTAQAAQQQRPKSPRLARSLLTSSFTLGAGASCASRCGRTGSPRSMRPESSSGVGFAEFHRSIDMLWGSSGDGTRHVALPEATTAR